MRGRDAAAIAATAAAFALLSLTLGPESPLHIDSARHILGARACLESGYCPSLGPPTTFVPFVEGAAWTRAWQGVLWLHAPPFALLLAVALMHALTVALIARLALEFTSLRRALGVGVFVGAASLAATSFPVLWNPAVIPLVSAVALSSAVEVCESDKSLRARIFWSVIGGAALGIGVSAHLSMVLLLAVLGWAILAFGSAPLLLLGAWTGSSALVLYATSRDACLIAGNALGLNGLLAALASIVVGAMLAERIGPTAPRDGLERKRYVLVCVAILALASSLPVALIARGASSVRYFIPVLILGVVALATRLDQRRAARWALVGLAPVVAFGALESSLTPRWDDAPTSPNWSMDDAHELALEFAPAGFRGIYPHLVGPRSFDLVVGIAAFAAIDAPSKDAFDPRDLLVLRMPRAASPSPMPAGWRLLGLTGDRVALIAQRRSFADRSRIRLCVRSIGGATECVDGGLSPNSLDQRAEPEPLRRAYPEEPVFAEFLLRHRGAIEEIRYSLRLRPEDGEPDHLLMAVHDCYDAPWDLAVEGVTARRIEGGLQLSPVTVEDAWLHFTTRPSSSQLARLRGWPADYVELRADELDVWKTLLGRRRCDGETSSAGR